MTHTLFSDISEFQVPVNSKYPYHFLSFRSNDGTYRDHDFSANLAWSKHAVDTGKLVGFLVYFVYETNWRQTLATFKSQVGKPHPRCAVMIDVESWGGKIRGNQSASLNALRHELIDFMGDKDKVIAYGNKYDLENLWPDRGDIKIVLANYSANPSFPHKLAHQFAADYNTPPFGPSDINSADGLTPKQFAAALGLGDVPEPAPKHNPDPEPKPAPKTQRTYKVRKGDTLAGIAARFDTTWKKLASLNHISDPNKLKVGQVLLINGSAPVHKPQPKPKPSPVSTLTYKVRKGDTLSRIAAKYGVSWKYLARLNKIKNPNKIHVGQVLKINADKAVPSFPTYRVRKGDTLSQIAEKHDTTWQKLASLNDITNPNRIRVGQVLRLK